MPKTEQEIKDYWKKAHDALTDMYYKDKDGFLGGKAAFDQLHAAIWEKMDIDLINAGYKQPDEPVEDPFAVILERLDQIEARFASLESK